MDSVALQSRLGLTEAPVPGERQLKVFLEAMLVRKFCGSRPICRAASARPQTWGDAMDVPLMVLVMLLPSIQAAVMLTPSA